MPFSIVQTESDFNEVLWNNDVDFNKGTLDSEMEIVGTGDAAVLQLKAITDIDDDFTYTTEGNYTLSDAGKLIITTGDAKLKIQAGEADDYTFATPANYTYDSAKIEVTGGNAELLDQRPAGATFFANYASDEDGIWGDGTLTGTLNGGATVSGGNLDVTGGATGKNDEFDADANADSQQTGCIRFGLIPDYSGSPASFQTFFVIAKQSGSGVNAIYVFHQTDGNVIVYIVDSTGTNIISSPAGSWSPTSGTEYEFELNYDITSGATRLFIDGTQLGSTFTSTGTRDAQIALLRIGNTWTNGSATRFKIAYFVVFSAVQHTTNYTPDGESGLPATIYRTDDPTIVNNSGLVFTVPLDSFIETATVPGGSDIQHHVSSDNGVTWKYWTGAAWAVTDDTFTQSNTDAEINTNIATLAASGTFKFRSLLNSDGTTQPQLDRIQVSGPATYSTTDNLYIDSANASQITPTTFYSWLTTTISSILPANTDAKVMFSNDGRVSWLTWGGAAWVAPSSPTARVDATSIADAQTNFSSLPIGSSTLDVRLFLYTSDFSVRPVVENINVTGDSGFETAGNWVSNQYSSGYRDLEWGRLYWDETVPGGTSIQYKLRAGNTIAELEAAAYTTISTLGEETGVTGQYIELLTPFTGTSLIRPSLDWISIDYITPHQIIISP